MGRARSRNSLLAISLAVLAMLLVHSPSALSQANEPFTPEQRKALEQLIHAYIVAHPEVLLEAQEALNARAENERLDKIRRVLGAHRDELYRQEGDLTLGNPNGDVTIIEFFDYNCPYCKRVAPELAARLATDGKIKLILKPMPYLSAASAPVAYLAAAAARQGKFAQFHAALLDSKGQSTEAGALSLAKQTGLDVEQLQRDAALPELKAVVDRSTALAKKLNIEGTPFFFVDDRYIAGMPDDFAAQLDRSIAEVRKAGCRLC